MLKKKDMKDDDFDAAVGMTRKWDARQAGREVARNTIRKLKRPPDFFLLFSTIHYEKNGGFQEFLDGVWDVLPPDTPLIGGTVAGFMNPDGCYTRGATALAVSYPRMDVEIGIGKNSKRFPKRAARNCAKGINKKLRNSVFENDFIFDLISGSLILQVPGAGRKRVLGKTMSTLAEMLYGFSLYVLQKGSGREDEILREFVEEIGSKPILGGSSMDDNKLSSNFQFYNKKVISNSIVALGIKTDKNIDVTRDPGVKKTDIFFDATKFSKDRRIIKKINNKPALQGFLEVMDWPIGYLDERMYRKTWHYPFCFTDKEGREVQEVLGLILGSSVLFSYMTESSKLQLASATGKTILNGVENSINNQKNKKPNFGLVVSCALRLEALGNEIFRVKEELDKYFKSSPYLVIYAAGESSNTSEGLTYGNLTFNLATSN